MTDFWGKADLHIHSKYSHDAYSSVGKILERAKKVGLNLIAITDHNTIEGAKEAIKLSRDFGLKVIIGEEIKTKEGDIIGIFIREVIPKKNSSLDAIREIHRQGGLAIIPHPFNWIVSGLKRKAIFQIFSQVDGIELFNAAWAGRIGREQAKELNASTFHLAPIASSDAHIARQVGRAFTLFEGKSPEDLYFSIKNKKTRLGGNSWTAVDKMIWLLNLPRRLTRRSLSLIL